MIPTSQEFLQEQLVEKLQGNFVSREKCKESFVGHLEVWWGTDAVRALEEILQEFAKLHVEAALKAASEKLPEFRATAYTEIILSAYPLTNIK